MWFTILKKNNTLEITNVGTQTIKFSITRDDTCNTSTYQNINISIPLGKSESINLPLIKGTYKIELNNGIHYKEYIYTYYPEILKSFIEDFQKVMCEGKTTCHSCDKSSQSDRDLLKSLIIKMLVYNSLVGKYSCKYFKVLSKYIQCDIEKDFDCMKFEEMVSGNIKGDKFLKKIISLYYLTFYYMEKDLSIVCDEIDDKFKFNQLKNCLLGVSNLLCLEEFNKVLNPKPLVKNSEKIIIGNREYVFTPEDFTTLMIPNYYFDNNSLIENIKISYIHLIEGAGIFYKGLPIIGGELIPFADIQLGKLVFNTQNVTLPTGTNILSYAIKAVTSREYSDIANLNLIYRR